MVGPDLVSAHFRAEPPTTEPRTITLIPVVELYIQAVRLETMASLMAPCLSVLLVRRPAVVLAVNREGTTNDTAHRAMATASH